LQNARNETVLADVVQADMVDIRSFEIGYFLLYTNNQVAS